MKKETRGRKPTGRVRTEKLNGAKFTKSEKDEIVNSAKESGYTQSDYILMAVRLLNKSMTRE